MGKYVYVNTLIFKTGGMHCRAECASVQIFMRLTVGLWGDLGRQPGGKRLFLYLVVKQLFQEETKCYNIEPDFFRFSLVYRDKNVCHLRHLISTSSKTSPTRPVCGRANGGKMLRFNSGTMFFRHPKRVIGASAVG